VGTTTCSNCRSVNQTGAIACVNCGELLVDQESMERRTRGGSPPPSASELAAPGPMPEIPSKADPNPLPPMPAAPPRDAVRPEPTGQPLQPAPPPRKRIGLAIAIVVSAVVLVALFALVVLKFKGTDFPDSLAGQPRQTSDAAKQFEATMADTKIQGVSFEAATYGVGSEPQEVLLLFHGLPSSVQQMSGAQFFPGFGASVANGFAAAGGGQGIDFATAVQASVDGVDHECAPISSATGAGGVLCLFKGETVGLLLLSNYADPQAALSVSEEAARAVN
jgi:hypothetical protein